MGLNTPLPSYMFLFAIVLIVLVGIGFSRLIIALNQEMAQTVAYQAQASEIVLPEK